MPWGVDALAEHIIAGVGCTEKMYLCIVYKYKQRIIFHSFPYGYKPIQTIYIVIVIAIIFIYELFSTEMVKVSVPSKVLSCTSRI